MPSPTDAPGRRLKNPLGSLSSYTYQLSLYMITPDAYDAFVASGRKDINALANAVEGSDADVGAYLIAQSGGVNNSYDKRAPEFDTDFYIDNLKIKQAIGADATQSSTNAYDISFTITEPYGFSFITKLRRANEAMVNYYQQTAYAQGGPTNPSRQFFIVGLRFLGYDKNGNIATGKTDFEGSDIDAVAGESDWLFQSYYDVHIVGIKFRIEGSSVTYNVSCAAVSPNEAFGVKRGRLLADRTLTASTFREALGVVFNQTTDAVETVNDNGLFAQMNQHQTNLVAQGALTYANEYIAEFIGPDGVALETAQLITPEDVDKGKWPGADIDNAYESTDENSATQTPDNTKRTITFSQGTSLIEVFDELIKGSTYLRDALKVVYDNNPTPDVSREQGENAPAANKPVSWYHVTPQIYNARWDPKIADWAYVTKYKFETYQTPVIRSSTVNPGMDYYGPHKRYQYWYTGENREILEYSQQLDNLYYNEVLGTTPDADGVGTGGDTDVPSVPGQPTPEPSFNSVGGGREAQNNYVTSLYSPDAYATAKIKILGDPDFLASDSRENVVYTRFYGDDGFRVNANGGQVFFEIDFKEAVDYDTGTGPNGETGVLDINDSILFFEYPNNVANTIVGVSYRIVTITSNFSEGKFTQDIEAVINTFPDSDACENDGDREERHGQQRMMNPTESGRTGTASTGFRTDQPIDQRGVTGVTNGNSPRLTNTSDDDAG